MENNQRDLRIMLQTFKRASEMAMPLAAIRRVVEKYEEKLGIEDYDHENRIYTLEGKINMNTADHEDLWKDLKELRRYLASDDERIRHLEEESGKK